MPKFSVSRIQFNDRDLELDRLRDRDRGRSTSESHSRDANEFRARRYVDVMFLSDTLEPTGRVLHTKMGFADYSILPPIPAPYPIYQGRFTD